jgi:hypothetical protein
MPAVIYFTQWLSIDLSTLLLSVDWKMSIITNDESYEWFISRRCGEIQFMWTY